MKIIWQSGRGAHPPTGINQTAVASEVLHSSFRNHSRDCAAVFLQEEGVQRYRRERALRVLLCACVLGPAMLNATGAARTLIIRHDETNVMVDFKGQLQSAANVEGPYTNVLTVSSPHPSPTSAPTEQFWRSRLAGRVGFEGGVAYTVAIQTDGTLWGWGVNTHGQLGRDVENQTNRPVRIGAESNWAAVAAGFWHTMLLKREGSLWGMGDGSSGQLGTATGGKTNSPVQVGTEKNWSLAACGATHTAALKVDGSLWAWGINFWGQLGNGTNAHSALPLQVGTDIDWSGVACGGYSAPAGFEVGFTMGLKADGSLWSWGFNLDGNLGNGTFNHTNRPARIGIDTNWARMSCGFEHTLALKSDGSMWAWGNNARGELGNGTNTKTNQPVRIGDNASWAAVACGGRHSLALQANGTLWAWSANSSGQLGDGTFNATNQPVRVGLDTDWRDIGAGGFFSLARKADGSLWAWGYDGEGQLGDGMNNNTNQPTRVISNTPWAE